MYHAGRLDNGPRMDIQEAFSFDDVLLVPAESAVLPRETDTATRLTRRIPLGIPLISRQWTR